LVGFSFSCLSFGSGASFVAWSQAIGHGYIVISWLNNNNNYKSPTSITPIGFFALSAYLVSQ
jgi:hypothetical protein